jgi:hypothetical protein
MFIKKKSASKSSSSTTYASQPRVNSADEVPTPQQSNSLLRALEPRIMLDAALVDTLVEGHAPIDSSPFKNADAENKDAKAAELFAN